MNTATEVIASAHRAFGDIPRLPSAPGAAAAGTPAGSPSTRSGYTDGPACSFMARTPLNTGMWRRRRRLQGLPRVTCAVARSTSGDRGGAETIPLVGTQKVPCTALLLRLTVLAIARTHRKADPASSAHASAAIPAMASKDWRRDA